MCKNNLEYVYIHTYICLKRGRFDEKVNRVVVVVVEIAGLCLDAHMQAWGKSA